MDVPRSRSRRSVCLVGFIVGLATSLAVGRAAQQPEPKVTVKLVRDDAQPQPAGRFRVGVRFTIEPGWHVYWRNPGGAGMSTDVDFDLPNGFGVGEIQWPLPVAFDQGGGIPGYGYEGTVMLGAVVQAPDDLPAYPIRVAASVSWLACRDVCVLGSAELEGLFERLVVDPDFDRWFELLPAVVEPGQGPFRATSSGGPDEGRLTVWLRWNEAPEIVEWFPAPPAGIEIGGARVRTRGGLTRIDAEIRGIAGARESGAVLEAIVVARGADGHRRGWKINVQLEKAQQEGSS